jgi:hypothetical protein
MFVLIDISMSQTAYLKTDELIRRQIMDHFAYQLGILHVAHSESAKPAKDPKQSPNPKDLEKQKFRRHAKTRDDK